MTAKVLWEIASSIATIIGLVHFWGTFWSKLLHPVDNKLMATMKAAPINMDKNAIIWKAWLGFNVAFSIGLIFFGSINFYIANQHLELIKGVTFISIASIICMVLLVWAAYKFLIGKVVRVFSIVLILFFISVLLAL